MTTPAAFSFDRDSRVDAGNFPKRVGHHTAIIADRKFFARKRNFRAVCVQSGIVSHAEAIAAPCVDLAQRPMNEHTLDAHLSIPQTTQSELRNARRVDRRWPLEPEDQRENGGVNNQDSNEQRPAHDIL